MTHRYPFIPKKNRTSNNKYFAKKTLAFGLKFDSKWEAERWGQLKAMERAGVVTELERQIKYDLSINDIKICDYVADFRYLQQEEDGFSRLIIEDAKGSDPLVSAFGFLFAELFFFCLRINLMY